MESEKSKRPREIIKSIDKLPPLQEDYARAVHITTPRNAKKILITGLDYAKYGMITSAARAYKTAEEVEFWSTDRRFNIPGLKVVVMDMTWDEWRLHNDVCKSPGRVPPDRIIGIVDIQLK